MEAVEKSVSYHKLVDVLKAAMKCHDCVRCSNLVDVSKDLKPVNVLEIGKRYVNFVDTARKAAESYNLVSVSKKAGKCIYLTQSMEKTGKYLHHNERKCLDLVVTTEKTA